MKNFSGLFAGLVVFGTVFLVMPDPVHARCKKCTTTVCERPAGRCVLGEAAATCVRLVCPGTNPRERRCMEVGYCDSWGQSTQNGGRVTTPGMFVASLEPSLDHAAPSSFRTASVACTPPPVTRVACVVENGTLAGACQPDPTDKRQTRVTGPGPLARQATAP